MKGSSSLVRAFGLWSLLATVVLALVLGAMIDVMVSRVVTNQWARAQVALWATAVSGAVDAGDLAGPLDDATRATMDSIFYQRFRPAGAVNLKVFNRDGMLVYSADGMGVGEVETEDEIAAALGGVVTPEIVRGTREQESARQFGEFGELIEVYLPLRVAGHDEPIGVLEVYESFAPVAVDIRRTTLALWALLAVGLGALYGVQIGVVKHAERRLSETLTEVEAVNERLDSSMRDLEDHSMGTLQALISAVDAKDSYTARHSLCVADYAVTLGRAIGLSPDEIIDLERACLLHDIGKIGVAERVLLKPARLNDAETEAARAHSEMGARIIESIPFLRHIVTTIRHHHEHWNGGGYPARLSGESIPRHARIIAVADAFDAMTADRPYRPALRLQAARAELIRCRGLQFDPVVVDAFLRLVDSGDISPALYHPMHDRHRAEAQAV